MSLKRKKFREQYGEYMIEGPNLIREALKEGAEIEALLVRPDFGENPEISELLSDETLEDRVFVLSQPLFREISDTDTPQGIAAVVRIRRIKEPVIEEGGNIVVLDRLQDPGNIGTVLRTADASGYSLAIFIKGTADPYSPKVVRSAAGALFRVPIWFAEDYEEAVLMVHSMGKQLVSTSMEAEVTCYECDLSRDKAIVIGNEGSGVSPELADRADMIVRIPMEGRTESLNASVACGILMYERIRRQYERSVTANS